MKRLEIFIAFLLIITKVYAEPIEMDGSDITWEFKCSFKIVEY